VAAKKPAAGDVTMKVRRATMAFEKEPSCRKVRSERNRRPKTTSAQKQWQPLPASIDHTER
jgi:predicted secreted Zn-dependent protease